MNRFKKVMTIVTAAAMVATPIFVNSNIWETQTVYAAESFQVGKNITATLENGVLTLRGTGSTYSYLQEVSPLEGVKDQITEIIVEDGITRLAERMFMRCPNLQHVTLADSVKDIGAWTFAQSGLRTIQLGSGLDQIEARAFMGCENLTEITLPESLTTLEEFSFAHCSNLKEFVFPSNMQIIQPNIFAYDIALQRITNHSEMTVYLQHVFGQYEAVGVNQGDYALNLQDYTYYWVGENQGSYKAIPRQKYFLDGTQDAVEEILPEQTVVNRAYMQEHPENPQNINGLAIAEDGNWYYYVNGQIDKNFTGIVPNEAGWWKVTDSVVDFNYNGVAPNEAGWWKITNGAVDFGFTGLAANEYGWWYLVNGAVDFTGNTVASNEVGWWKITNGAVDFGFTGLAANEYGWWYLVNGAVDFTANTVASNEAGWWKITNGAVDFAFTGEYEGYNIVNGHVEAAIRQEQAEPQREEGMFLQITVNDTPLRAKLEENSSAQALYEHIKAEPLTLHMHDYGNFEKVSELGFSLPTNDTMYTTQPGDIILYQGNELTFYYDTNTWEFTKVGVFQNVTQEYLMELFGEGDITAVLAVEN